MDGEHSFKLEDCVCELRGKMALKKGPPEKAVNVVAVETQEASQQYRRQRRTEITIIRRSLDPGEGTSGLAQQGSDSEYSDEEQK